MRLLPEVCGLVFDDACRERRLQVILIGVVMLWEVELVELIVYPGTVIYMVN